MGLPVELLLEAVMFGVLLGCFYAAVSMGLSVSFGLLDVPHVAHPAVMIFGSYCTYVLAQRGLDPILAGLVLMAPFFVLGMLLYRFYYETCERRGTEPALRLMGANPVRIKQWAFGIATAVTALAGALLIIVGPVEPTLDRVYIGRTFSIVVLAGLGSMTGTVAAGLILGISESIVLIHPSLGASWAPAVSFTLLLLVLGVRPQGLFGR